MARLPVPQRAPAWIEEPVRRAETLEATTWRRPSALLVASAVVVCAGYLAGIFRLPPVPYTEGLYGEIAREMLRGASWIVPHLDGAVYVQKPPLFYWLEAAAFAVFGVHIWAARLVSLGAALGACVVLWRALQRVGLGRLGVAAALILASSPGWIVMAHTASMDMLFSSAVAVSLVAFYAELELGGRYGVRIGWIAMALAFLGKGLAGPVLIGVTLLVWLVLRRRTREVLQPLDPWGLAFFAATAGGWSLLAAHQSPGFFREFFWVEHFGRYLGTRIPHDYSGGPAWFYLPWILIGFAPWCVIAPLAAIGRGPRLAPRERRLMQFGAVWAAVVVLFFSFSVDKAPQYILPAVPGLALLAGVPIAHWSRSAHKHPLLPLAGLAALLPLGVLLAFALVPAVASGLGTMGVELSVAGIAVAAILSLGALSLARKRRRYAAIVVAAVAVFPLVSAAVPVEAQALRHRSVASLLRRIDVSKDPGAPVVLFRLYDKFAVVPWRLHRKVWLYDSVSPELHYAQTRYPARFPFLSHAALQRFLRTGPLWLLAGSANVAILRSQIDGHCSTKTFAAHALVLVRLGRGCELASGGGKPQQSAQANGPVAPATGQGGAQTVAFSSGGSALPRRNR